MDVTLKLSHTIHFVFHLQRTPTLFRTLDGSLRLLSRCYLPGASLCSCWLRGRPCVPLSAGLAWIWRRHVPRCTPPFAIPRSLLWRFFGSPRRKPFRNFQRLLLSFCWRSGCRALCTRIHLVSDCCIHLVINSKRQGHAHNSQRSAISSRLQLENIRLCHLCDQLGSRCHCFLPRSEANASTSDGCHAWISLLPWLGPSLGTKRNALVARLGGSLHVDGSGHCVPGRKLCQCWHDALGLRSRSKQR